MRGLPHARDSFTVVLQWLEYHGRLVVNGERAFAAETSKVSQLVAMSNFGLNFAKTTAVFGTGNLVHGAEQFLKTLGKGEGFWIRFNRAGCGRGLCLCHSIADVEAFLLTGKRSPDEIYILQQWINVPEVVRMEFSFGRLLYGLEVKNVHSSAVMAPCGCVPQFSNKFTMCSALLDKLQPLSDLRVARTSAIGLSALTAILGSAVGVFMTWLAAQPGFTSWFQKPSVATVAPIVHTSLVGIGLLAVVNYGRHSVLERAGEKHSCPAPQNPVRLLRPTLLQKEYPLLTSVVEKVKPMMSDMGTGTMALDVVIVKGEVTVLDINFHTNYGTEREYQHGIEFEDTGIGAACSGLSSLLRGIEQETELDYTHLPSENLVFGIGLPRTGTHSLAEALKNLGYRGRHNSSISGKRHVQYTPKSGQFAGYFHVDTSHCRRYEQLFNDHPNARFVVSTRLDEDWKESMERITGEVPEDMPMPHQYLSEVLRFFVNHHATHRLMVCNVFAEPEEQLWNKLSGFLPLARKLELRELPFPRIIEEADGRLSKAVRVHKSPSHQLITDFSLVDEGASTKAPQGSSPEYSETASQSDSEKGQSTPLQASRVLSRYIDYKKTYQPRFVVRPDTDEVSRLSVLTNARLTPKDYDRNIFHIEMKVQGTPLADYDAGDCLGIYPENSQDKVSDFIAGMGFDATELLEMDSFFTGTEDGTYVMSVQQMCTEYLDLFAAPTRGFYLALSKFAKDWVEKETLAELTLPRKSADFEAREALAVTHASTILEFPSLKLVPMNLLDLVPLTKPRLYSIASSRHAHPGEVHLLVGTHTWDNSKGIECTGLSSGFLEKLSTKVVASLVRSPVLKLPKNPAAPVIMAGMGTGMAPFRGFIEERATMKKEGQKIGPMRLYFGARQKKNEFLYQKELEGYAKQGFLTLRCAWSRDQAHKIYVQMLIAQDGEEIWNALCPKAGGSFYICGPIAPVPDIKKAITKIFEDHGSSAAYLDELEATGRFAMEVY